MKKPLRVLLVLLLLGLVACGDSEESGLVVPGDPGALLSIELLPTDARVIKGASTQLRAIGRYEDGSTRDLTRQVTWSSQDPLIAAVDDLADKGKVSGHCCGITSVRVQLGTIPGRTLVTVDSAP